MKKKRKANKTGVNLSRAIGDTWPGSAGRTMASHYLTKVSLPRAELASAETFAEHLAKHTLRAFLAAVNYWRLDAADAARLVGAEQAAVEDWTAGKMPTNEEVLARMTMVALIRTALDIVFSSPLSTDWMTLPNSGYPYLGLSPVAYVGEHGWPGLFWILRQSQALAVGN